jgi:hypothetical protein
MRQALFIAVLVLTVAHMGEGQKQSARAVTKQVSRRSSGNWITNAFKHRFMLMRRPLIASTLLIS